jgi:hypothetical protein
MKRLTAKKALAASAVVLAVGGGAGGAIAASQGGSASPSAFLDAVAKHLGISSDELRDATKAAAIDQVNAALAEGQITKEQADELKSEIEAGEWPPFFGPPPLREFPPFFGPPLRRGFDDHFRGPGDHLSAAADYLGLTFDELLDRLDGKSLADVARAEDKSVDGLEQAIVDAAKKDLDEAVAEGDLTQEEADAMLERLRAGIDDLVNAEFNVRSGGDPRLLPGAGEKLRWHLWLGRPFA